MYNRIIISGGEASIHPKFHEYIRYAKEIGYNRVQTVTNGNMFSRGDFCKKVFDAGLDEVTFSLHGHTPKLHDYFTAAPGSFDRALRGLIHIKKFYPKIIINIDIVVNKVNVEFLPKMVEFYMKLGVYEFDILQIIPFGRGFENYKDQLFYKIEDYLPALHATWKFSKIPGVYMWTNRFPSEAFEGYEDLIQDPRKIKSEVMGEAIEEFTNFIESHGIRKPHCYGEKCEFCFLKQYCHDYINHQGPREIPLGERYILGNNHFAPPKDVPYIVLRGEEFPSDVYALYGSTGEEFLEKVRSIPLEASQKLVNIPFCIRKENNSGIYEWQNDFPNMNIEEYTKKYITNFYRKKSPRCRSCKYNGTCEGIHINFIRSYGFKILNPIQDE